MAKCKYCGEKSTFKTGDLAVHTWSDNTKNYPISESYKEFVKIVNPKCLYSYKSEPPSVKGHDYICGRLNDPKNLTFIVEFDKLSKVEDPNSILKEMIAGHMNEPKNTEDVHELSKISHKNQEKNRLKEKKRWLKEQKKKEKIGQEP